jgi:hypothetical protein
MRTSGWRLVCVVGVLPLVFPLSAQQADAPNSSSFTRYLYPLSKTREAPEVTIDVTDAPDAKPWAEQAKTLVSEWYPHVCQLLATDNYRPPKTIQLIFKPDINAPAYASGGSITVNAKWIAAHPDDFGMIIHELTHVIQSYPGGGDKPGWLVEGIADYIRWWRYEPESARTPINPQKAKYTDSYRTTAAFLAWVVGKYDRGIVRQLDQSLREKKYSAEIFKTVTGKTLDTLWEEYIAGMRPAVKP